MRNGQHWPISGGSAICGNSGVSVCVRSTTRMRRLASAAASSASSDGRAAGRAFSFAAAAAEVADVMDQMVA